MAHEQPHETTQSFWEHLEALRWAILRSLGVLLVAMVGFFAAMPWLFDHLILAPTHGDFLLYRWIAQLAGGEFAVSYQQFDVELINIRVASQFMTHISTSFWCALVVTFPYLIYEIWHFVRPALYRAERHAVAAAFSTGTENCCTAMPKSISAISEKRTTKASWTPATASLSQTWTRRTGSSRSAR